MAAGDTIAGQVRIQKELASGDKLVPFGPVNSSLLDNFGDVSNQAYINPDKAFNAPPPTAGNRYTARGLVFNPGEILRVQHLSNSLSEAIDYDADEFEISVVDLDLNTGQTSPKTLTVNEQELTSNPTSSTSSWVTFYEETVPDRHRYFVAGSVNVAAVEAS